ncbi:MAG: alkaline phosphatase D family protein [Catalinimonas sp.]
MTRYLFPILPALLLMANPSWAQMSSPTASSWYQLQSRRLTATDSLPFAPGLAPFYHGVASGDPLTDRVILWTRVTPDDDEPLTVSWEVATDPEMQNVVLSGDTITNAERDYTVKVDAVGLAAGTTYYYRFATLGRNSITGRTKTAPTDPTHLKFAVVSCSNLLAGYFNAYGRIADRNDLDGVIHLGDYIYEYPDDVYGDSTLMADEMRYVLPRHEIVELNDYRTRYSVYRLDRDLIRAHQQHPFITVWDDHESANDAWKNGAENHDPDSIYNAEGDREGNWETRLGNARQAYFEWLPLRDRGEHKLYRKLEYGDLADLIMLDTRIEGREEQVSSVLDPAMYAEERTLLGTEQKAWLKEQLATSTARWKIVANQVMFGQFNVGWFAAADPTQTEQQVESIFVDIWDGYPAERREILTFLDTSGIDNTVILSGDFHSSFAYDLAYQPSIFSDSGTVISPTNITYDPATGLGSHAVEFLTSSITAANFDENLNPVTAAQVEFQINQPLPVVNVNPNPHMKYTDLDRHGYYVLDVKGDSTQANFYYVNTILQSDSAEQFGAAWQTKDGANRLTPSTESEPKAQQDAPAPTPPFVVSAQPDESALQTLGLYPNPTQGQHTYVVQFALNRTEQVEITLHDQTGRRHQQAFEQTMRPGVYRLVLDAPAAAGVYYCRLRAGSTVQTRKLVIVR